VPGFNLDVHYHCALPLVAATPPHLAVLEADRDLADEVAVSAMQTINGHNRSGKVACRPIAWPPLPGPNPPSIKVAALRHRGKDSP
jgi:hypothetical protein